MLHYKKFTKNIGLAGMTNLFSILRGIIVLPFIAKLLGTENYGIWSQIGVTMGLFGPVILLGLPFSLNRFLPSQKDKKKISEDFYSVLFFIAGLGALVALIIFLFSGLIASFFGTQPFLIKLLGLIILFQSLNAIILNTFRAFSEIKKYSFFSIFQSLGEAGLIVLAVIYGLGLTGAVAALLAIRVITFLVSYPFLLKKIGLSFPRFTKLKNYLFFGVPTVISSFSYWIVTCSDRYLIGYFLGTVFVGYYSPAYTVGNIINFFAYPFIIILPAVLSKLFDENKLEEVKRYLNYSLKYFLIVAIPAVVGVSVLSKQIVGFLSNRPIAENAFYVTPFVAFSILLYGISSILISILALVKKTKTYAKIWTGSAILNILLNIVLIPRIGIIGAAATTLLSYLFSFILVWKYSQKEIRVEINSTSLTKIVLASILMGLLVFWLNPYELWETLLTIAAGAVLYLILIIFFKVIEKREIEFLKQFFSHNKS